MYANGVRELSEDTLPCRRSRRRYHQVLVPFSSPTTRPRFRQVNLGTCAKENVNKRGIW